jgi:hypothetical protein
MAKRKGYWATIRDLRQTHNCSKEEAQQMYANMKGQGKTIKVKPGRKKAPVNVAGPYRPQEIVEFVNNQITKLTNQIDDLTEELRSWEDIASTLDSMPSLSL